MRLQDRRYRVVGNGAVVSGYRPLPELGLGRGQQPRLGQQVDGGGAQHLARVDGGLVSQGRLVAGDHLPAVAGDVVGPYRQVDLGGGALVAHVAHIGRAGVEGRALIQGHEEVVEMAGLQGLDLLGKGRVVVSAHAAGHIAAGVGGGQLLHEFMLLGGAFRDAQLGEVVVEQLLQRVVADGVGQAVHEAALDGGVGHQGRTLGDFVHPLVEGHAVLDEVGADHVEDTGLVLDHVGAGAAGVQDGIVDAGIAGHVLPQELDAHVHQLHGVQGAAPPLRGGGRLGGQAVERVEHLDAGVGGAGGHLVAVAGVPRQCRVQAVPQALPGHVCLGGHALLAGAAVEDHRAGAAGLLQVVLHADGGGHSAGAQQVMAAAVAAAALDQLVILRAAGSLAQAGQGVILRQKADDRLAAAVGGGKGGGDAADALLHLEALLLQHLHEEGGGLDLLHGQLCVVPDGVSDLGDEIFFCVDGGQSRLFLFVHIRISCVKCGDPRPAAGRGSPEKGRK